MNTAVDPMISGSSPRVGYVLKVFPRISETFILNEILELERQGIEIEIFSLKSPTEPRFHGNLSRLRASVHYLSGSGSSELWDRVLDEMDWISASRAAALFASVLEARRHDGLKELFQSLLLASHVRRLNIGHLHAHFATLATRVALTAHKIAGVPFSFTAHAKDIYHQNADVELITDALTSASFAVTVTDHNLDNLSSMAPFARGRLRRIYNGIPLNAFPPLPEAPETPPRFLSVGRLVEKKGFPYLLEACRLLKARGRDFVCEIIGTGDQEQRLRSLAEELDITDCVEFMGAQPQEVVRESICKSCLMVLACIVAEDGNKDALPTVLLEAMSMARPVVSTDLPGVTEIVDSGVTGLLVPQKDSRALADALDQLLGDAQLRQRMGQCGREKAEVVFDLERNVSSLASLMRESSTAAPERTLVSSRRRVAP